MRWPWQRDRPEHPPGEAPREPAAPTAAADRVPPAGWAFLPPLQRTIGSVQLTSDPGRFAGALSSWGDPSFTGRMSHLVSAQAPPGVIDVDGGGPVPAAAEYPSGSGEMTLLPPPAPRVRPTPAGYGGVPATAQRSTSDGGSPDGVSLDGGSPHGRSLLAADPTTFPVLHVDPSPLQRSDSGPDADPMTLTRSLPDTEVTGPAASLPGSETSAPTPAPEAFWSRLPGESSPPRLEDSSTSDRGATYVQIPSPPAVQRTSSGPDSTPSFGQVPRRARLGLGMPLSFSEPGPELTAATEPTPGHFPEPFPLPVQRALAPDLPAPPTPHPAVYGGKNDGLETVPPGTEAGTAQEASGGQATSEQATAIAGTDDPASLDRPAEQLASAQDLFPEAELGSEAAAAVSEPSEDETAPLLSVAGPAGTLEPAGRSHAGEGGLALQTTGTGPALPIVSRLSVDDSPTDDGEVGRGPDVGEAHLGEQTDTGSVAEPHGRPLVERLVAHPGDVPPNDLRVVEAGRPPTPGPNAVGVDGAAQTANPLLQHSPEPHSSPPLQRNFADTAPAASGDPVEDHASPAGLSLRPHMLVGSRSADGPRGSAQADAGKPEAPTPSIPSSVAEVQRAHDSENPLQAREIPTSVGPVVLRVVDSAAGESFPETWQRLASMPVVAPIPTRDSVSRPAMGPQQERSAARMAWSGLGDTGVAAGPGSTESDAGFTSGDRAPAPDAEVVAIFDVATGASPAPSVAVGKAIQRTIALPGNGTAETSAWPASGPLARTATGTAMPDPTPTGPRTPSVSLQRSGASITAVPETTRSTDSPWAPESGFAMPAPAVFLAGPAATVTESRPAISRPLTLGLAAAASADRGHNQNVLQRDAEIPPPDSATAVPAPVIPPTSAPEGADGGAAVQGAEPVTAGPGLPGQASAGAAPAGATAAGNAAQASPEQLEELAKRLAGPLIRRIKAEMLLDRERRGLRTDAN
ncbi:hypothetical protein QFZ79_003552 [Arthrobacter sp. V4I6]|uniref:hypothetical protein n=1 Tax=unclassified Arthrobacter TaxID=235627 RepID=UPI00278B812C|nr:MULTISPECIES: hypothetical protein [unclassified Arthrobacter]MDQ0821178.1 hypothetical protein [Arthrobacter sp. V1I7]MDQ0855441.1 hypothetical protein [Arthrobacter sp. V4I6]